MTDVRSPRPDAADLERELRDMKSPTPPADLAAQIKLQIPSSEELVRAAGARAETSVRHLPWLRLAATIAIAALAGTVAWQTLRSRDVAPAEEPPGRAFDDVVKQDAPEGGPALSPPPPAAVAEPSPRLEDKLSAMERDRSDLAKEVQFTAPSPEGLSDRRNENSAVAAQSAVQPVVIAELVPVSAAESTGEKSRREQEGVPGGVEGGVVGGVHGGVPGGVVSGVASPPQEANRFGEEVTVTAESPTNDLRSSSGGVVRPPAAAKPAPKPESRQKAAAGATTTRDGYVEPPLRAGGRLEADPEAQPDTMIFREAGVNRFVVTADDRLSTFAIDVDTGSYSLARSYIERGLLPPPEAIRLEEFVNAMRYSDPPPRREDFALFADGSESPYPDAAGLKLLRFAVKAREIDDRDRKPANLTFVVDVSGSMDRENRLGLVKRALGLLLDELRREDRVALVVYGTSGRIVLRHTRDHSAIREAIARLTPEGSTNAEEGLRLGYDLADEGWAQGEINRIVLCSDGVANVGLTGPESILARIGEQARRGIQLTTVGFGMGNYNDELMERLANQGDGTYHYVDELEEARKVFVENLTGTLQNVAKDAKIQVEFDPRTVERWRLLGYENRDIADRDFRNDRVDAGEVGAGQASTALYEVRLRGGVRSGDRLAKLQVRWKSAEPPALLGVDAAGQVREISKELRAGEVGHRLDRASRDLRLAALAAAFAERLKGTRAGAELRWPELAADADDLVADYPRDTEARALAELIDRAARLAGEHGRHHRERSPDSEREDEQGNRRLDEPR